MDKPEAHRLADALEDDLSELGVWGQDIADSAATELRRLHSANEGQTRLNTSLVLENSQLLREKLELLKAFAALPRRETEQEPYCHIYEYDLPSGYKHRSFYPSLCKGRDANRAVAVYARPPRREWVEMTDEDIINAVSKYKGYFAWLEQDEFALIKAVIQAVKEKNGYE